ncbi:MAG: acetyl-CoA carboxylase biotin carboxyl carrier protein [Planctomycetota bacterium]
MDVEEIRRLLDELASFMKKNDLSELEIDIDGASVKLRKTGSQIQQQVVTHTAAPGLAAAAGPAAAPPPAHTAGAGETDDAPGTVRVTSPMVGTFYRSPKADADHLVEVADEVEEDTVLCIIEAMKVMNEIKAEHKGRVVKILVENGDPVEYGQPLFLIATSE